MESISTINDRLKEYFGSSDDDQPIFRIVWADEQTEKRRVWFTDSGIELVHSEVREVKKYPYIQHCYVLERLVVVPDENLYELPTMKMSYEPIWTYRDMHNQPVRPIWVATKFVVDTLYAALGKRSLAKYVDSEKNTTPEGREQRITELQGELFGNDTEAMDAVHYKEGIVVPSNYEKGSKS
jgi:hypothetical protein